MIVPSSDKRLPLEIRGDKRPSSDFVPVNRGPISSVPNKKGSTQSEIENAKVQFFQKERILTQAREEIRKWEKWNEPKKVNDIKRQVKDTRKEVMTLGKKIIDFDRRRGRSTDNEEVFTNLYSDLR